MEIIHQLSSSGRRVSEWIREEEVPFGYQKINELTYEQFIYLQYWLCSKRKEEIIDDTFYSIELVTRINQLDLTGCKLCIRDQRIGRKEGELYQLFVISDLDYLRYSEAERCKIVDRMCLYQGDYKEIQRFLRKLDMSQVQHLQVSVL